MSCSMPVDHGDSWRLGNWRLLEVVSDNMIYAREAQSQKAPGASGAWLNLCCAGVHMS